MKIIFETTYLLSPEEKNLWTKKILTELDLPYDSQFEFVENPKLILGYKLTIGSIVYEDSLYNNIQNNQKIVNSYVSN
jgi:hypothetical protein